MQILTDLLILVVFLSTVSLIIVGAIYVYRRIHRIQSPVQQIPLEQIRYKATNIQTDSEWRFFYALERAVERDYYIFVQLG